MAKKDITTKELLKLMKNSPVVKAMSPADVYVLVNIAMTPNTEKAQNIYKILDEEKKRLQHVDNTFNEIVDKAMDDMGTGLTTVKVKSKREKLEAMQKELVKKESEEAEKLLKAIE